MKTANTTTPDMYNDLSDLATTWFCWDGGERLVRDILAMGGDDAVIAMALLAGETRDGYMLVEFA